MHDIAEAGYQRCGNLLSYLNGIINIASLVFMFAGIQLQLII
jgi:hypothetical protein